MDETRIGTLIETIYASAFEEDGLDRLLQTVRTEFHASHASFAVFGGLGIYPPFAISTLDAASLEPYSAYYHKLDPGIPGNNIMPVPKNRRVFQTTELLGQAAWFNCEFHNDFLKSHDMSLALASNLGVTENLAVYFVVHRPMSGKEYSADEINLLHTLSPHLNRSLQIYRELGGLRATAGLFETAFDAMGAAFLLDASGRVLRLNKSAGRLLEGGGVLSLADGRLGARHAADDVVLAAAFDPARPLAVPADIVLRGGAMAAGLQLAITPVKGCNIPLFANALHGEQVAFMVTATALSPSLQNLMALYGLTRAEAEVTLLLSEGLRAPQIAAHRETSIATVNTQLKHIYAKTGVDGQIALILKLLGR